MKRKASLIFYILSAVSLLPVFGQADCMPENCTTYRIETTGSAASGEQTPFWIVSNRYGTIPLESGNGLLCAGVFHNQQLENQFHWAAGIDLIYAAPRYKNMFAQQIYAELGYKSLLLSIGSKERYHSIIDRNVSSGDMVLSPNARPFPEINLSLPEFTILPYTKGWIQVKGDFAVGRSFDKSYLIDHTSKSNKSFTYVNHVLWHHKSGFLRLQDSRNDFPFFGILGGEHWVQWGGESTDPEMGKQPQSLKDFLRVLAGKEGGTEATLSAQLNVLGNHYGSFYFATGYQNKTWGTIQAYHQHYFEDMSGIELSNGFDGLWGIEFASRRLSWIKKIVLEYLITKDQSGPMHFIAFDRDKHSGRGGGWDDYYNNGEYTTGTSYFGRSLGSALIISPEYNENGDVKFTNNRLKCWHIGINGDISARLSYRLLFTSMQGWGQSFTPFLDIKSSVATLAEIHYTNPHLKGWAFGGAIAFDTGNMIEKNQGFYLSIQKQGILKNW